MRSVSQAWRLARADGGGDRQASEPEVDTSRTRQATWTGICSAAITVTAWNRRLGHHRSDQLHRTPHRLQFGLQLGDAALGRDQLGLLAAAQARLETPIDAVLPAPGGDRLVADAQHLGDLSDRPAGLDQVQHLAAELGWIPASSHAAPRSVGSTESNNTTPLKSGKTTSGDHDRR
jgi:hypothetical protein